MSNARLLDRCAAGDAVAWEYLISRYERLVVSIARREGLPAVDAADVAQITFAALLEGIDTIREPDRLAFWLSTVARREAWKWQRARSHEEVTSDVLVDEPPADRLLDTSIWISDAIESLDEPCRTLIKSVFFSPAGPSYEEVAALLRRPVGSVGPLRARCLETLRRKLEETPDIA